MKRLLKNKFFIGAVILAIIIFFIIKLSSSNAVAVVNGKEITQEQVDKTYEQTKTVLKDVNKSLILKQMVINELLLQKASEIGVTVSEDEITNEVNKIDSQNPVDKILKDRNMNIDEFKDEVKKELIVLKIFDNLTANIEVTDNEAYELFSQNLGKLGSPYLVNVSHILVNNETQANEILARLKKGENFAKIATNESLDGSKIKGGNLGYFPKGTMVKEFEAAAFSLDKIGQISNIVKSQFGYHILELEGKITDGKEAYAYFEAQLKQVMLGQKRTEFLQAYFDNLMKNADIKYPNEIKQ